MTTLTLPEPGERRLRPITMAAAFIRRDWAIARSYRVVFVMGLVQSVVSLFFLYFLGHLVGHRSSVEAGGLHGGYFAYAVLGTTLLGMFTVSLTAVANRLRTDQTTGTLEVLFTMPPRPAATVLASSSYQVVYSLVVSLITVLLAVAFGMRFDTSPASLAVAVATLVGALLFFGSLGVLFAAFVIVFKRGESVTALGTSALSLLGGVYFPLALLPRGLRVVADAIPFTWAVSSLRLSLLADRRPVGRLGELWLAAAVLAGLALWLFEAALRHARRHGTLGQY
ncbi:MAG: ABC transporter permease [Acidimicrobiales bacterium]